MSEKECLSSVFGLVREKILRRKIINGRGEINKRDRKGYDFVAKKSFGFYAILSSLGAPFCFRYVVTFVLHVEFVSLFIIIGC
jgi:hypothetical protein